MPRSAKSTRPTVSQPGANAPAAPRGAEQSPLSLSRLRAAFAEMLGADEQEADAPRSDVGTEQGINPTSGDPSGQAPSASLRGSDPCEISPRAVIEAMLFVGRPDDSPFSAREMAAAMRGVSPAEIEAVVAELNRDYERDAAPYEIIGSREGYRLALRSQLHRMRDKLNGRLREAKLTPTAVEVLSIVAYNQPTTVEAINLLRGAPSGSALASLVRRKLVRVDRPADRSEPPKYSTTERFLRLFGLESLAALPRSEELEKI
jgi:segregation and condensation protein B